MQAPIPAVSSAPTPGSTPGPDRARTTRRRTPHRAATPTATTAATATTGSAPATPTATTAATATTGSAPATPAATARTATTPGGPGTGRRPGRRLSRRGRKLALTAHVTVSVGWLGLDLGLLTLGLTGLLSGDPRLQEAAYRAMGVFAGVLIIPISLTTLLTGVLLSLGTQWGLFRYYWVAAKFWLTLAATTASIFALRAQIGTAVRRLPTDPGGPVDIGDVATSLVAAPSVALLVYLAATVLSTYKPWGRTAAGKRI